MMNYMDLDNLKFLLFDVVKLGDVLQFEKHRDFDLEGADIFLDGMKDLADQVLFPSFKEMDEKPAEYRDGAIHVHPQLGEIFRQVAESGMIGSHFDPKFGGMNMPHVLVAAAEHILHSANNNAGPYLALTTGAANLLTSFGSEELTQTYLPKMLEGKWMGTMSLTEPEAGSSLGDLTTSATPVEAGYYMIKGQKIFISGGDHQFGENFVHMVIARIPGSPEGAKGISLFVVPKLRINPDGSLEPNDVITAGDYQKLGQRGYCTSHLIFGEHNDCRGWLVGEPNKGLKYMFQLMNQARLEVGNLAVSIATAAYQASLSYAKERAQGRRMTKEGMEAKEQTLIINHPDVRRMLLKQKSITEGALALLLETYKYYDLVHCLDGEEKGNAQMMLDLLTPVAKTYPSDLGIESVSNGIQVLGGYGYTKDFLLEQYFRDIRITSIYEGTSGIQALDLLSRKMTANNGQAMMILLGVLNETIAAAKGKPELVPYAQKLEEAIAEVQKIMEHLLPFAFQRQYESFLADASLFMELTGHLLISWQWLRIATAAIEKMESGEMRWPKSFYQEKIHTMKYYFVYELPRIKGLSETIRSKEELTILKDGCVLFE